MQVKCRKRKKGGHLRDHPLPVTETYFNKDKTD